MKYVKFTRDCLALGEHCEAGSIKELPEKTCAELISADAAMYFTPPAKAEKETAESPKHETSDIVTKSKKAK